MFIKNVIEIKMFQLMNFYHFKLVMDANVNQLDVKRNIANVLKGDRDVVTYVHVKIV